MANWIIVVDDDAANLHVAGRILSRNNMRVTALKSGQMLLDYIAEKGQPDLILLDINMPGMDGFETLRRLREQERSGNKEEIPVIFLTADEDTATENLGFEAGVSDYIRKPFDPEVLLRRINAIVSKQEKIASLRSETMTDKLTGLMNMTAIREEFPKECGSAAGSLMMIDLDAFKMVNDIYGHDTGDKLLIGFAEGIKRTAPEGSLIGRSGGDEFAVFCRGICDEEGVAAFTRNLNRALVAEAKKLMGEEMDIPLGVSLGAVFVPRYGTEYESLLKKADRSLYFIKKNGKHGYILYTEDTEVDDLDGVESDLHTLSEVIGEHSIPNAALQLDRNVFSYVYRYVLRYIVRNQRNACKVLFTVSNKAGLSEAEYKESCDNFCEYVKARLRKSDILTRSRQNQFFVLLTDIREAYIHKVISSIIRDWREQNGDDIDITFESEFVGSIGDFSKPAQEAHIVVVDDDTANLKIAGHILSGGGFHVTALRSGQALLDYVEDNIPDLILLDIKMPEMDGYETLDKLRGSGGESADIPVIFLTADESSEAESKSLSLGAIDFIKKPFIPEVLLLRVRHTVELVTLQRSLSIEVDKKTRENRELFVHVVKALADAIDAKDTYTNGHSGRVAEYSREIARRAGYSAQEQSDIYMMGLLHDVGKIGIPDTIINKPSRLTDEEFEIIKTHPVMGARILEHIEEMPKLVTGARWHHERFAGGGYPDGLKGEQIPEEARIIAVADAYDAMSSRRSYRDVLPQEKIIEEIKKGKGTQFDPHFADIMLQMIYEDTEYTMREE